MYSFLNSSKSPSEMETATAPVLQMSKVRLRDGKDLAPYMKITLPACFLQNALRLWKMTDMVSVENFKGQKETSRAVLSSMVAIGHM